MEVAKLVLEYVKVLAWPVFATVLLWVLRAQLRHAIGRLTRVETPAGSAEFAAAAADVLDDAEELSLSAPIVTDAVAVVPRPTPSSDAGGGPVEAEAESDQESRPDDEVQESSRARQRLMERMLSTPHLLGYPNFESSAAEKRFRKAMDTAATAPRAAVFRAWDALEGCFQEVMWARGVGPEGVDAPYVGPTRRRLSALAAMGLSPEGLNVYVRLRKLRNHAVHSPEEVSVAAAEDFVRSCRAIAIELQRSA